MRIIYLTLALLMTLPAYAGQIPDGFESFDYPLADGIVFHGWNDGSQEPLKHLGTRHYGIELSIAQDITSVTATGAHRITGARFRTISSLSISGEGPTLPLDSIRSAPSAWQPLSVSKNGERVLLKKIGLQGNVHLTADAQIEALHVSNVKILAATAEEVRKLNIEKSFWLGLAKQCKDGETPCNAYIQHIELELTVSDAEPIVITITHIPGC